MVDPNNQSQFGNREDTEEQAQEGGGNSTGQFDAQNSADLQEAGEAPQSDTEKTSADDAVEGGNQGGSDQDDD